MNKEEQNLYDELRKQMENDVVHPLKMQLRNAKTLEDINKLYAAWKKANDGVEGYTFKPLETQFIANDPNPKIETWIVTYKGVHV